MPNSKDENAVAITGAGLHGALGDVADAWRAIRENRTALRMNVIQGVGESLSIPGAPASKVSASKFLRDRKLAKYMNPGTAMATNAAGRALRQAGLLDDVERLEDLGLFIATGLIAFDLREVADAVEASTAADGGLDLNLLGKTGLKRCHPLMPFKMLLNMPIGIVSIALGIKGQNFILYPDVGQVGVCLESAVRAIRAGRLKRALVGGVSHSMSLLPLFTMKRRGRLAESIEAAQPFRDGHAGQAPADMAAFLVLESTESARERKAAILAELTSVACANIHSTDSNARYCARARLWNSVCCEGQPDLALSTGNLDAEDDRLEMSAFGERWKNARGNPRSWDGILGYGGPAALTCSVAIAAQTISSRQYRSALVSAGDSEGAESVVALRAWEARE